MTQLAAIHCFALWLSICAGGMIEGRKLNGIFLNAGMCQSDAANGLIVSSNRIMADDFKEISIADLRNDSTYCRGIQIGLINTCKHLKGIQIGLWNVNSKRRLPFINWNFKNDTLNDLEKK